MVAAEAEAAAAAEEVAEEEYKQYIRHMLSVMVLLLSRTKCGKIVSSFSVACSCPLPGEKGTVVSRVEEARASRAVRTSPAVSCWR